MNIKRLLIGTIDGKIKKDLEDIKAVIKRRCIALGVDCTNTQHSFYTDLDYDEELTINIIENK